MSEDISGIILAGGRSRRFGSPKAFAEKDGIPFYQYSVEALSPFTNKIVVVTNKELLPRFNRLESNKFEVIIDSNEVEGEGPLAGIYSVMKRGDSAWYMVLPVDVPFVQEKVLKQLMGNLDDYFDAIIPIVQNKNQPLFGLYNHSVKQQLLKQLRQGERSMHKLLSKIKVDYVAIEESESFININRKIDYETYINNKNHK